MPDVSDYRQQGDLAIWGFERLISKYDRRVYDVDDDELSNLSHESLVIAPPDQDNHSHHSKKDLLNRLEHSLLPLLSQHIAKIYLSPDRTHLSITLWVKFDTMSIHCAQTRHIHQADLKIKTSRIQAL
ncbi:hypothetical protein PSTT_01223 [Puccinia striiformis]|uniref:Uncharacterized protein n=1 Tax=Puccinia striiformis TaxID=27350 RepID=A0A2S4W4P3_9BASI|nr:hypothetical protein PSTT_01223 [Puccinia striiformis]